MLKGEKARFKMRPEYGYAGKGCRVAPPAGCARDEAFLFDIHLVRPAAAPGCSSGISWMGMPVFLLSHSTALVGQGAEAIHPYLRRPLRICDSCAGQCAVGNTLP